MKAIRQRFIRKASQIKHSVASHLAMSFYCFCHYLPIRQKTIIFESEGDFCDNAWALYQYLRRKNLYRFVWIAKHPERFQRSSDTIFLTRFGKGQHWRALYHYATARFNFFTHWTYQPYRPRKGQTVVALWHGMPLKGAKGRNMDYYDFCTITCPSPFWMKIQSNFMGRGDEDVPKMLPVGYPRNDLLVRNISEGISNPFAPKNGSRKVILWMPTFRASSNGRLSETALDNDTGLPLLSTEEALREFNEYLREMGVSIIVKIHHLQAEKPAFGKRFTNIVMLSDEMIAKNGLQLYEIVGKSDALLTDYSSILFDYLLTDKPEAFILDDFAEYEKSRGFLMDASAVKSYLRGHHICSIADLKGFVRDVLDEKDPYREQRRQLCDEMHVAKNGDACERICERLGL
jgi:CDP-glycerol glycerophosphotransferase (TagB/SpsB family)